MPTYRVTILVSLPAIGSPIGIFFFAKVLQLHVL